MHNALAVYTPKASLKGRKLVELAEGQGLQLRFMGMGGYILGEPAEVQDKALASVSGGGLLVVGAFESDAKVFGEFDNLLGRGDRAPIASMLNSGRLPWCELYTGRFNYQKLVEKQPNEKKKLDGSVPKDQWAALRNAKTRYIIHNQSRRKNGGQWMTCLADLLAKATGGIIADYQRPSR